MTLSTQKTGVTILLLGWFVVGGFLGVSGRWDIVVAMLLSYSMGSVVTTAFADDPVLGWTSADDESAVVCESDERDRSPDEKGAP